MKKEKPAPAAVTYHRVSTIDQDPTLARDELRRAAALRGLPILEEIEETGSGYRNNRPGLQRVMALAAAGQVTHVLVWKLSRFGRSTLDALTGVKQLNDAGVTFVCTSQMLEAGPRGGPMAKMVTTILAAVAEFELETIRENTRLGMAGARARGKQIGRPRAELDMVRFAKAVAKGRSIAWLAKRFRVDWNTARDRVREMGMPPPAAEVAENRPFEGSA